MVDRQKARSLEDRVVGTIRYWSIGIPYNLKVLRMSAVNQGRIDRQFYQGVFVVSLEKGRPRFSSAMSKVA